MVFTVCLICGQNVTVIRTQLLTLNSPEQNGNYGIVTRKFVWKNCECITMKIDHYKE